MTDPMIPQNIADLRRFADDIRSIASAITAVEPSMLSEALHTIAEYAESTAELLNAMDSASPDPSILDRDDLAILALLAGHASGREGMVAATDVIRRVTGTEITEPVGETRE